MYVANPQILMNVLRESVGVISTVPTQCQDTRAPVTLGIRSMKMDMLVKVRIIACTNILLHMHTTYDVVSKQREPHMDGYIVLHCQPTSTFQISSSEWSI